MKKSVNGRREDDTNICNENDAAEQGIKRGEPLPGCRRNVHYRSHSTQYHAGIVYRIQPPDICCEMIAENADEQGGE